MRKLFIATTIITLLCAGFAQGQQQGMDMDSQIAKIADNLVSQIKASGKKKVTVLDFTDLQGNTSELGRFIAEQISVDLVEKRDGFSIMDRANLKTILDEHKLTIEGLVEPENAKKLGQFSGVDAIILGNVTPLDNEVSITAKIIATDTAEIVGAAKGYVSKGKEITQLSSGPITPKSNEPDSKQQVNPAKDKIDQNAKEIEGLRIKVESLKETSDSQNLLATFIFENTTTNTLGVALGVGNNLFLPAPIATSITDKQGTELNLTSTDLAGIMFFIQQDRLTQISPGDSVDVTAKYHQNHPFHNIVPPLRVQMQVWIVPQVDGEFPQDRLKQHNFVFDVAKLAAPSLQGVAPNNSTPLYQITRPAVIYNNGGGGRPVR